MLVFLGILVFSLVGILDTHAATTCELENRGSNTITPVSSCSIFGNDHKFLRSLTLDDNIILQIKQTNCVYPTIEIDGDLTVSLLASVVAEPLPRHCTSPAKSASLSEHGGPGGSFWSSGGHGFGQAAEVAPQATTSMQGGIAGGHNVNGHGGGLGGGVIQLVVHGLLTLEGRVRANGQDATASNAGGGSGGSVNITCDGINGTSSARVEANGGMGSYKGGAGAGGEIFINSPSIHLPTACFQAFGGLAGFTFHFFHFFIFSSYT